MAAAGVASGGGGGGAGGGSGFNVVLDKCRRDIKPISITNAFSELLNEDEVSVGAIEKVQVVCGDHADSSTAILSFRDDDARKTFWTAFEPKLDESKTSFTNVGIGSCRHKFNIKVSIQQKNAVQAGIAALAIEEEDDEDPWLFVCPITSELMENPCTTSCGHTFEKQALTDWLEEHDDCPTCRRDIDVETLVEVHSLRSAIEEYKKSKTQKPAAGINRTMSAATSSKHAQFHALVDKFRATPPGGATIQERDRIAICIHSLAPNVYETIDTAEWIKSGDRAQILAAVKIVDWIGRTDGLTNEQLESLISIILHPDEEKHGRFTPYHARCAIDAGFHLLSKVQRASLLVVADSKLQEENGETKGWKRVLKARIGDVFA